jgi:hypothetical protein
VAYYATGSSTGKDSIKMAAVDFAGSDSLLKASDYAAAPDLQMYPATAAAVVPVVHLPSCVPRRARDHATRFHHRELLGSTPRAPRSSSTA